MRHLQDHIDRIDARLASEPDGQRAASPKPDGLLDVKGVAAYLGVSERTVKNLVAERKLKSIKIGRLSRYSKESVDAYLRTCVRAR